MATLTVWKFDTAEGAQDALNKLIDLSKQQLIDLRAYADAAAHRDQIPGLASS